MSNLNDASKAAKCLRDETLRELHGSVPFDRALWGVGEEDDKHHGMQIRISASELMKVEGGRVEACVDEGRALMLEYNTQRSRTDVIGRLFARMPKVVQVVDVEAASANRSLPELWGYLKRSNVAHLLLVGTYSSFGYAWVTLYRTTAAPFKLLQVEHASRAIPDALFRWQLIANGHCDGGQIALPEQDEKCTPTTSALNERELAVLLAFMNGHTAEEVVQQLASVEHVTTDVVYQAHRSARKKLNGADDSPLGLIGADSSSKPRTF